jgi:hypothetical protein
VSIRSRSARTEKICVHCSNTGGPLNTVLAHLDNSRILSLDLGWGSAMKCLACGAEMRLMDVRTDPTTPFGIERRIFQCSSCRQSAQRLRFDRSRLPVTTSATMTHTNAPAIRLQGDCSEPSSRAALVEEKPHSGIVLKEEAGAARASAWARTVEKLRNRQLALEGRAAPWGR